MSEFRDRNGNPVMYVECIEISGNKLGGITTRTHVMDFDGRRSVLYKESAGDTMTVYNPQSFRAWKQRKKREASGE